MVVLSNCRAVAFAEGQVLYIVNYFGAALKSEMLLFGKSGFSFIFIVSYNCLYLQIQKYH